MWTQEITHNYTQWSAWLVKSKCFSLNVVLFYRNLISHKSESMATPSERMERVKRELREKHGYVLQGQDSLDVKTYWIIAPVSPYSIYKWTGRGSSNILGLSVLKHTSSLLGAFACSVFSRPNSNSVAKSKTTVQDHDRKARFKTASFFLPPYRRTTDPMWTNSDHS